MEGLSPTQYLIYTPQNGGPERNIATLYSDKVEIHDSHLKQVMKELGIQIPPHLQGKFEGKKVVHLNNSEKDALFVQAFVDVYFKFHMDKKLYRLSSEFPR
jgi:hypothetical protein